MDDLYLLRHLSEGYTITAAAKKLGLTQPAASQRLRKIEAAYKLPILKKLGRHVGLTTEGVDLCNKAIAALSILEQELSEEKSQVINIGTRPEVGRSWLWPAIRGARKKHPNITFHIHFSSGEDILKRLGTGELDVVLTSAPLTTSGFKAIEVAKEDYVFVGAQKLAASVKSFNDLSEQVLIEHDRSFPFLRYLSAKDRARLSFYDVWFLSSSELMVQAVESGFGLGIVPEYLVKKSLNAGKLAKLKLPVQLDHDFFRLIFRVERDIEPSVKILAEQLKKLGLR
jgi:DNA-binding transcriptional LysR family regulator